MKDMILNLQQQFDQAELHADTNALQTLLAEDFRSIGPKGFVLDKLQWIGRHTQFRYLQLETAETEVRLYPGAAIVTNMQHNKATYNGNQRELSVRVAQVWIKIDDNWQLASIQFSPMADVS